MCAAKRPKTKVWIMESWWSDSHAPNSASVSLPLRTSSPHPVRSVDPLGLWRLLLPSPAMNEYNLPALLLILGCIHLQFLLCLTGFFSFHFGVLSLAAFIHQESLWAALTSIYQIFLSYSLLFQSNTQDIAELLLRFPRAALYASLNHPRKYDRSVIWLACPAIFTVICICLWPPFRISIWHTLQPLHNGFCLYGLFVHWITVACENSSSLFQGFSRVNPGKAAWRGCLAPSLLQ